MTHRFRSLLAYFGKHPFQVELLGVFLIIFLSTVFFSYTESLSFFDSLYFTIITLAGVGYGDITPHTNIGKSFAMLVAGLGLPLYILTISLIVTNFLGKVKRSHLTTSNKRVLTAVKALIIHHNSILLVERKNGDDTFWDLPGSIVRYGENPKLTLKRGVLENTGLTVSVLHSIGIRWQYIHLHGDYVLCHTYESCLSGSDMLDAAIPGYDATILNCQWLAVDDIINSRFDLQNTTLQHFIKRHYLNFSP